MKPLPIVAVFADGSAEYDGEGGSGFRSLAQAVKDGWVGAQLAAVSNHEHGSVSRIAKEFGIPFYHFPKPRDAEHTRRLIKRIGAKLVVLWGWNRLICGHNPRWTLNIHPGYIGHVKPERNIGGHHFHGDKVHEEVLRRHMKEGLQWTAISIHFVSKTNTELEKEKYDDGPVFHRWPVPIIADDTVETLRQRVKAAEHQRYPIFIQQVLDGDILWDGKNRDSVRGELLGC
jgi:phosphoribosylglycinamide formyltransferase-1